MLYLQNKIHSPYRFLLVVLLLASPLSCAPAVPFYCRRFKADCRVRRDNICCRAENIATTTTTIEKQGDSVVEESIEIIESEDTLVASSSIIEEVVVAPEKPLVSLAFFISTSSVSCSRSGAT